MFSFFIQNALILHYAFNEKWLRVMGIVVQILWFCQVKDTQRCSMYCLVYRSETIYYLTRLFHNIKYQWLNPNLFWKNTEIEEDLFLSFDGGVRGWPLGSVTDHEIWNLKVLNSRTKKPLISSIETFFFQVNAVTSMTKSVIQLSLSVNLSGKILDLHEKKYSWLIPQATNI